MSNSRIDWEHLVCVTNTNNHYKQYPLETFDIMEKIYGSEKMAIWCEITAFKYRMRLGLKNSTTIESDLKKENDYLTKMKQYNEK